MPKQPGVETVTVIRKTKIDRFSDEPAGDAPEHEVDGCAILPRTSHEEGKGWVIVEGRMVVAPYDADVLGTDWVRTPEGDEWEVDGEPGRYKKGTREKACIFYLKRIGMG